MRDYPSTTGVRIPMLKFMHGSLLNQTHNLRIWSIIRIIKSSHTSFLITYYELMHDKIFG